MMNNQTYESGDLINVIIHDKHFNFIVVDNVKYHMYNVFNLDSCEFESVYLVEDEWTKIQQLA